MTVWGTTPNLVKPTVACVQMFMACHPNLKDAELKSKWVALSEAERQVFVQEAAQNRVVVKDTGALRIVQWNIERGLELVHIIRVLKKLNPGGVGVVPSSAELLGSSACLTLRCVLQISSSCRRRTGCANEVEMSTWPKCLPLHWACRCVEARAWTLVEPSSCSLLACPLQSVWVCEFQELYSALRVSSWAQKRKIGQGKRFGFDFNGQDVTLLLHSHALGGGAHGNAILTRFEVLDAWSVPHMAVPFDWNRRGAIDHGEPRRGAASLRAQAAWD